jgi:transcriptional regulator with XRE-family HTH domain
MDAEQLGPELRRLRLQANMTLDALAAASGVSVRGIGDLERAVSRPRMSTLIALADGLGLGGAARRSFLEARTGRVLDTAYLPPRASAWTGRRVELERIGHVLQAARDGIPRPILLSGLSGIGKTALAREAALRAAVPFHFADATGFDSSGASLHAVLAQLISHRDRTSPLTSVDGAVRAWRERSADSGQVTIVDGVASEALARLIIASHTSGTVLLTSRRPMLGLEGAARLRIAPLPAAEAEELLGALLDTPADTSSSALARACEGLPGALVAAADVANRAGSAADALRRMPTPSLVLRTLTTRSRSMIVALENSHALLSPQSAAVLRAVAALPTPAIAATSVVGTGLTPTELADALDDLVDHGLLEVSDTGYRLLEMVRAFARARF